MVVGQFSIQWINEWLGRKGAMWTFMGLVTLVSSFYDTRIQAQELMVQAAVVEAVSSVWWHFTLAKVIAGIGIGCVQATLPVVSPFLQ